MWEIVIVNGDAYRFNRETGQMWKLAWAGGGSYAWTLVREADAR